MAGIGLVSALGPGSGSAAVMGGGAAPAPWWFIAGQTCVAAWQPIGAANLAASYINLANPGTFDAFPGTAPGWAVGVGWQANGTTQYLRTGVIPGSLTWSFFIRGTTSSAVAWWGGSRRGIGTDEFAILAWGGLGERQARYENALSIPGGGLAAGIYGFSGLTMYTNGAADPGAFTGNLIAPIELYLLALNNNGAPSFTGTPVTISAAVVYSTAPTAPEVAALAARMAAL